jgi:hypothetical protein
LGPQNPNSFGVREKSRVKAAWYLEGRFVIANILTYDDFQDHGKYRRLIAFLIDEQNIFASCGAIPNLTQYP